MERIIALFLFVSCTFDAAFAGYASDAHTIDKRRYISDAEWATEPYKFVAKLTDANGWGTCTANLVGEHGLVTAAHCIDGSDRWYGYDGTGGRVSLSWSGIADGTKYKEKETVSNDYALLYRMDGVLPGNDNILGDVRNNNVITIGGIVKLLGFGCLKIMSDEEIATFREAYIDFLQNTKGIEGDEKLIKTVASNNAWYQNELMSGFIRYLTHNPEKYPFVDSNMFNDCTKLKESTCFLSGTDVTSDVVDMPYCQGWGGNSGGGAYINTAGLPRMTSREYIGYLQKQRDIEEDSMKAFTGLLSHVEQANESDKDLIGYIDFFEVSSKEELITEIKKDIKRSQDELDKINQEIQSVSEGKKVNSDWMLFAVDSVGNYSLRAKDYAAGGMAASVKNIGAMAIAPFRSMYDQYVTDKVNEQEVQEKSGIPKYLYKYKN